MEMKNINRFRTLKRSQIGGSTTLAAISEMAVMDKQYATSAFEYPKLAKKNGVTILKFISAT